MENPAVGSIMIIKGEKSRGDRIADLLRASGSAVIEVTYGDSYSVIHEYKYEIRNIEEDYFKLIREVEAIKPKKIINIMAVPDHIEAGTDETFENTRYEGLKNLYYLTRSLIKNQLEQEIDLVLISEYVNEVTGREKKIRPMGAACFGFGKII
jgi:hypothetical protein